MAVLPEVQLYAVLPEVQHYAVLPVCMNKWANLV